MNKEYINFLTHDFKDRFYEFEKSFNNLEKTFEKLSQINIEKHHFTDSRITIFKSIVKYMVTGLTKMQALQLVADELNINYTELQTFLSTFSYEQKAIKLYAKHYTINKMKKAGYSRQQIATVLCVSTRTIDRFINQKCEF